MLGSTSQVIRLRFLDENNQVLLDMGSTLVKDGTRTAVNISGVYEVWLNANPGAVSVKNLICLKA